MVTEVGKKLLTWVEADSRPTQESHVAFRPTAIS
jgi:hypothetical protein